MESAADSAHVVDMGKVIVEIKPTNLKDMFLKSAGVRRRKPRELDVEMELDTDEARREIDRFFKADHAVIIPLSVREFLDEQIARKLA